MDGVVTRNAGRMDATDLHNLELGISCTYAAEVVVVVKRSADPSRGDG